MTREEIKKADDLIHNIKSAENAIKDFKKIIKVAKKLNEKDSVIMFLEKYKDQEKKITDTKKVITIIEPAIKKKDRYLEYMKREYGDDYQLYDYYEQNPGLSTVHDPKFTYRFAKFLESEMIEMENRLFQLKEEYRKISG